MPESTKPTKADEAGDRFRLLVESVRDYAIFMLDPEGHVTSWNRGAERLKQYTAKEIIGQHFSKFYLQSDLDTGKPARELEIAVAEGRVEDEGWRIRKDGTRFWASVVITALYDRHGKLTGFGKVTRDLTARRAAEENLRVSEEQFRLLVDRVEEYAIYLLDPTGKVMTWNHGAEKIKQFSASEIIGKNFACFYTAEDVAANRPQHNLDSAMRLGHVRDRGLRVRRDGTNFPADVLITALRNDEGELRGFSKITRDLTDQMRVREIEAEKIAALKANAAKDEFLAKLSHELRTPLTPALAAASYMVENATELPAKFRDDIHLIRRNVQLEARLIDDLLDLTRISTGKIDLHQERVDAHVIANEALKIVRSDLHRKKQSLTTEFAAQDHFLWADPVRLEQVFWNLISNAVKFTPAGGEISLKTWNEEDHFRLVITDGGIGIASEKQANLFRAFEQGESGISRQFGGLGLGLAICKSLVELHGGQIEVQSRGRGFGTSASVRLKCFHGAEQAHKKAEDLQVPARYLRVLLVEDHLDTRRVLSRLLEGFGYAVAVAGSVEEALEIFRREKFDVILSDIGLPDGSGYDVIAGARKIRDVTGIALTGYGMSEDVRRSEEAGFAFHLTKPIDASELRSVLLKASGG